jgi:hypothetical protein
VQRADLDVVNGGPDKAVQICNVASHHPTLAAGNFNVLVTLIFPAWVFLISLFILWVQY